MFEPTYIELDRSALEHNISVLKEWMGNEVVISSVVKGNAYGHGLDEFVPMVMDCGIDHFSVFSANEAYQLINKNGNGFTLMIMGMVEDDALAWAIQNGIEFFVFDLKRVVSAISFAKKIGQPAIVHLELETGMNRTGMHNKELKSVLQLISDNREHIVLKGVCTHFAGAESISNYHRVKRQREKFKRVSARIRSQHSSVECLHAACSAASLMYPTTRYDMVRIGILQYGFFPSKEVLISYLSKKKIKADPLRRVLSWKSTVMDINNVKAGEFIGYGTSYLTNIPTRVAIVPVGYANGFKRSLSNQGRVLINGKRLNVVGMVNMNMMAIDVTELDHVDKGDEVVFIGHQGDIEMSVASFGDYSHQVNYELLTRLPRDIPRQIV